MGSVDRGCFSIIAAATFGGGSFCNSGVPIDMLNGSQLITGMRYDSVLSMICSA